MVRLRHRLKLFSNFARLIGETSTRAAEPAPAPYSQVKSYQQINKKELMMAPRAFAASRPRFA